MLMPKSYGFSGRMQHIGAPGNPGVKTSHSNAGVPLQSLVEELRSHVPHGQKT